MVKIKKKTKRKIRRRSATTLRVIAVIIFFFGAMASVVYILFFGNLFNVNEVRVSVPKAIPVDEVLDVANEWLDSKNRLISRRNNSYLLDKSELENLLRDEFQKIKEVSVDRVSRNVIEISIIDRKPVGIWCIIKNEECFYFDLDGIAYLGMSRSSGFLYTSINDHRRRNIILGGRVESDKWLDNILATQNGLKFAGLGVRQYNVASDSYDEFTVDTTDGWEIRLSNSTNVRQQISSLVQFLATTITDEEKATLEYVDLRVQDRIYYK